uniref:Uncharacterized protein n=1 Tax=Podarcis muralis TaxID=64176 RepID=A0A670IV42_PODMU
MAATFAARYKKDLSTETLKAKLVHQKSISRKSRHKEFNKGRQFGLIDVNAQASRNGEPPLTELQKQKQNIYSREYSTITAA